MRARLQPRALAWIAALLLATPCWATGAAVAASPSEQASFPPRAVVALRGTPHLWIADDSGALHWGGDTRALQGKPIDWDTRIEVSIDTLRVARLGDPYLSAGLLKDGDPIYLVKWETSDAVPRLLHIQCIRDVELFGINGNNYGNFVLDRASWESRFGIPVSSLQRGELEATDPGACTGGGSQTTSQRPRITITRDDLARLEPTLRRYSLGPDDLNIGRTSTFVLPDSNGTVLLAAPLARAPGQNVGDVKRGANLALGVLRVDREMSISSGVLKRDIYLVRTQSGSVVFTNPQNQDLISGQQMDVRQLARSLPTPQIILSPRDICFGWSQVQVCAEPAPRSLGRDFDSLGKAAQDARSDLGNANLLSPDDQIDPSSVISEAEGTQAVNGRKANIIAVPSSKPTSGGPSAPPENGTFLGIFVITDAVVGLPNGYPQVPAGTYAVRSDASGTQAVLLPLDGSPGISVPIKAVQVRAAPESGPGSERPMAIVANLCFGSGGNNDVCFWGEPD